MAYLFDVNAFGIARIITHAPYTVLGGAPEEPAPAPDTGPPTGTGRTRRAP